MRVRQLGVFGLFVLFLLPFFQVFASSYFSGSISATDLTCAYLADSVYSDLNLNPISLPNTPQWVRIKTATVETSAVNIYVNSNLKYMVVSYRGSMSSLNAATVSDWISNFNIFSTDIIINGQSYGLGHRGFWYEYLMVRAVIINTILLPQYADYKLFITGHSQGSAIATLSALELKLVTNKDIELITFGSPKAITSTSLYNYHLNFFPFGSKNRRYISSYNLAQSDELVTRQPSLGFLTSSFVHVGQERRVPCSDQDLISCHFMTNYLYGIQRQMSLSDLARRPFKFVAPIAASIWKQGDKRDILWEGLPVDGNSAEFAIYYKSYGVSFQVSSSWTVTIYNNFETRFVIPADASIASTYYICINPSTFSCGVYSSSFSVQQSNVQPYELITPSKWNQRALGKVQWTGVMDGNSKTFSLQIYRSLLPDIEVSSWTVASSDAYSVITVQDTWAQGCNYYICVNPTVTGCERETNTFCIEASLPPISFTSPSTNAKYKRGSQITISWTGYLPQLSNYVSMSLIHSSAPTQKLNEWFVASSSVQTTFSISSTQKLQCGYYFCVDLNAATGTCSSQTVSFCIVSSLSNTFSFTIVDPVWYWDSIHRVNWNAPLSVAASLDLMIANVVVSSYAVQQNSVYFEQTVSHTWQPNCGYYFCMDRVDGLSCERASSTFCVSNCTPIATPKSTIINYSISTQLITFEIVFDSSNPSMTPYFGFIQQQSCDSNNSNQNLLNRVSTTSKTLNGNTTYTVVMSHSEFVNAVGVEVSLTPSSDKFGVQAFLHTQQFVQYQQRCFSFIDSKFLQVDYFFGAELNPSLLQLVIDDQQRTIAVLTMRRAYVNYDSQFAVQFSMTAYASVDENSIQILEPHNVFSVQINSQGLVTLIATSSGTNDYSGIYELMIQYTLKNSSTVYKQSTQLSIQLSIVSTFSSASLTSDIFIKEEPFRRASFFQIGLAQISKTPIVKIEAPFSNLKYNSGFSVSNAYLCCFEGVNVAAPVSCKQRAPNMNYWNQLISNNNYMSDISFPFVYEEERVFAYGFSLISLNLTSQQDSTFSTCYVHSSVSISSTDETISEEKLDLIEFAFGDVCLDSVTGFRCPSVLKPTTSNDFLASSSCKTGWILALLLAVVVMM